MSDFDTDLSSNPGGMMLINGLNLSMTPPPLRGEEDYGLRVLKKLEKALQIAQDRGLTPILCGQVARKSWDMDVFKALFKVAARYPEMVVIAQGDMLDRNGNVRPKTILDLLDATGNTEIFSPGNENLMELFLEKGMFRLVPAEGGEFNVHYLPDGESLPKFVVSQNELPQLGRITQSSVCEPASVVVLEEGEIEVVPIEKAKPILSDAKYDVGDDGSAPFKSELVARIETMLNKGEPGEAQTTDEQLKDIFTEQGTSLEAREIVLNLKDFATGASI